MRITGGTFRGRPLKTLPGNRTRPTQDRVRQALFNIIQGSIEDGTFLDLFAGTGSVGLEALSRGAKRAVFVENSRAALRVLHANIEALNVQERVLVIPQDAHKVVPTLEAFDVVFADPPYGDNIDNLSHLLKPHGLLIYESNAPIELTGLTLRETRYYGDTQLHLFIPPLS